MPAVFDTDDAESAGYGGDERISGEVSKLPQVPAKGAWPCATVADLKWR